MLALAGYIPALLAHYRFGPRPALRWIWFGAKLPPVQGGEKAEGKEDKRDAGTPAEKVIVGVSAVLGVIAAVVSALVTS
jgi:hypothetical protein